MQIQENFSLKKYNSFGIDVNAALFSQFKSVEEVKELIEFNEQEIGNTKQEMFILGGGSNILFTKKNYNGLVLKNEISGIERVKEDDRHIYIRAGAGVNWHELVLYCIQNNFAGIENLSLIPGNVGASPMQNIGAYGVEIKDVFYELEAWHIQDKDRVVFNVHDCEFGYRESVFKRKYKNQFIITSVTFKLNKYPVYNTSYGAVEQELEKMHMKEISIRAVSQAVINIRSSKLPNPAIIGNAGSFFKNPEVDKKVFEELKSANENIVGYSLENGNMKLAAGWLIEQCGWKGYRKGDAGCHSKQALVLVNYGKATGAEIVSLSEEIIQSVKEKFGLELEREVNII